MGASQALNKAQRIRLPRPTFDISRIFSPSEHQQEVDEAQAQCQVVYGGDNLSVLNPPKYVQCMRVVYPHMNCQSLSFSK